MQVKKVFVEPVFELQLSAYEAAALVSVLSYFRVPDDAKVKEQLVWDVTDAIRRGLMNEGVPDLDSNPSRIDLFLQLRYSVFKSQVGVALQNELDS